jgi:hypothetical protein
MRLGPNYMSNSSRMVNGNIEVPSAEQANATATGAATATVSQDKIGSS